jgi:hypothetical protein
MHHSGGTMVVIQRPGGDHQAIKTGRWPRDNGRCHQL